MIFLLIHIKNCFPFQKKYICLTSMVSYTFFTRLFEDGPRPQLLATRLLILQHQHQQSQHQYQHQQHQCCLGLARAQQQQQLLQHQTARCASFFRSGLKPSSWIDRAAMHSRGDISVYYIPSNKLEDIRGCPTLWIRSYLREISCQFISGKP